MSNKTQKLTHRDMRQIRTSGRRKALEAMLKMQERERGPRCRICKAPLSLSLAICTACGSQQNDNAGGKANEST